MLIDFAGIAIRSGVHCFKIVRHKTFLQKSNKEFKGPDDIQSAFSTIIDEFEKEAQRLFIQGSIPLDAHFKIIEIVRHLQWQASHILETHKAYKISDDDIVALWNLYSKIIQLLENHPFTNGSMYHKLNHLKQHAYVSLKMSNSEKNSGEKQKFSKTSKDRKMRRKLFQRVENLKVNTIPIIRSSKDNIAGVEKQYVQLINLNVFIGRVTKEVNKSFLERTISPEMFFWLENAKQFENQAWKAFLEQPRNQIDYQINHATPNSWSSKVIQILEDSPIKCGHIYKNGSTHWTEVAHGSLSSGKEKILQQVPNEKGMHGYSLMESNLKSSRKFKKAELATSKCSDENASEIEDESKPKTEYDSKNKVLENRIENLKEDSTLTLKDIKGKSIFSESKAWHEEELNSSCAFEESTSYEHTTKEEFMTTLSNGDGKMKNVVNIDPMTSGGNINEKQTTNQYVNLETLSNVTTPLKEKLKIIDLDTEREVLLDDPTYETNATMMTTNLNRSSILPLISQVNEVEMVHKSGEINMTIDSSFSLMISTGGELSNYVDLKFEMLQGSSLNKWKNKENEFIRCDFTTKVDSYSILKKEKSFEIEVEKSKYTLGELSSSEVLESSKCISFEPPEHLILRNGGHKLTSAPEEGNWRQTSVMVLMDNEISSLELTPECPNLVLLFLQRNTRLRMIAESFFDNMQALRVVDLSGNRMSFLPSSLYRLDKLQVLILRDCKCLDRLSKEIKCMKGLEVFDLFGTELLDVPDEIQHLCSLKNLQLMFYGTDDEDEYQSLPPSFISPDCISRLKSLEALSIFVHPEDSRWKTNAETIIGDLAKLNTLTYLDFYFPRVELLEYLTKMSQWKNICSNKFKFVVGQNVKRIVDRVSNEVEIKFNQYSRCLRIVNGEKLQETIRDVLKHVTALYLDHHLIMYSLSEFGMTTMKDLRFCTIRECPNVKFIIDDEINEPAYPRLEHLGLHYLWKLEHISRNPLVQGSFCSLKSLIVDTCSNLEFILSESMVQCLYNVEELVVENCELVREIIQWDGMVDNDIIVFRKLSKLKLCYLPQLRRFWWRLSDNLEDKLLKKSFIALNYVAVWSCPNFDLNSLKSIKPDLQVIDKGFS